METTGEEDREKEDEFHQQFEVLLRRLSYQIDLMRVGEDGVDRMRPTFLALREGEIHPI